jgi:hypothetical protein
MPDTVVPVGQDGADGEGAPAVIPEDGAEESPAVTQQGNLVSPADLAKAVEVAKNLNVAKAARIASLTERTSAEREAGEERRQQQQQQQPKPLATAPPSGMGVEAQPAALETLEQGGGKNKKRTPIKRKRTTKKRRHTKKRRPVKRRRPTKRRR